MKVYLGGGATRWSDLLSSVGMSHPQRNNPIILGIYGEKERRKGGDKERKGGEEARETWKTEKRRKGRPISVNAKPLPLLPGVLTPGTWPSRRAPTWP